MADALHRKQRLPPDGTSFDLLVIGGGITGAGIALDAALRGLRVCLLEQCDFAFGTSSRSTKLIHGGLRYLKQGELGLVRKVGKERAVIFKNAPHLVKPVQMLLPVYRHGSLGKTSTAVALWLYDRLAGVTRAERFTMLSASEVQTREPLLSREGLVAGAVYTEYQTDDARLTLELIKTAVAAGAVCVNYARVDRLLYAQQRVSGVACTDLLLHTESELLAKQVVSAAGPWVDKVRLMDGELQGKQLALSKGVHLVVSGKQFPLRNPVYVDVPGNERMIFAIPRGEMVYLGTTDTPYSGDIQTPTTEAADVLYLLNAVNAVFPNIGLQVPHILSSWAGIRPLIRQPGKAPADLSRKDEILVSPSGLISIAGGKLTGYRAMAEKVVNVVVNRLKKQQPFRLLPCSTKHHRLCGFVAWNDLETYTIKKQGEAAQVGFSGADIERLVATYGRATDLVIENAYDLYPSYRDKDDRLLMAELMYTVEHEMVQNISDFLIRRTGLLYFNRPYVVQHYRRIAQLLAAWKHQPEADMAADIAHFEEALQQATSFR